MAVRPFGVIGVALVAACSGKRESAADTAPSLPQDDSIALAHDGWSYVPPDSDPFGTEAEEPCPSVAYEAEDGFLELETDYCAVATFVQPLRTGLRAGDRVRFVVWNLDLWAPEPYEALRQLRVGGVDIWSEVTAVPGNESVNELEMEIPVDVDAGVDCFFHLRNHGVNSWRLGDIERRESDPSVNSTRAGGVGPF